MKDGKPTYIFLALMGGKYNTSSAAVLKIDHSKLLKRKQDNLSLLFEIKHNLLRFLDVI